MITPIQATVAVDDDAVPIASPAIRFLFFAHPDRYELARVGDEDVLVPNLIAPALAPGHGGVAAPIDRDAKFDFQRDTTQAIARFIRRGEVPIPSDLPIPREFLPPGQPDGGYLRVIRVRSGRGMPTVPSYCTPWDLMAVVNGRTQSSFDHARYAAWRAWLVREGHAPAPNPAALDKARRDKLLLIEQRQLTPSADQGLKEQRVAVAKQELEVLDRAIAKTRATKPKDAKKGAA